MEPLEVTIKRWFTYHPPTSEQIPKYEAIRDKAKEMGLFLAETCPRGDGLYKALDALRTAVMWANAAIACEPTD